MRAIFLAGAVLLAVAGCDQKMESSNPGEDMANVGNTQVPAGEMIFCREINRRTTREDCDDLTATAEQSKRGTAAFNVPPMTRGKATMIQLAISLDPPPVEMAADAGAADNAADDPGIANETSIPEPLPSPTASATPPPKPTLKGPAPAEIVEALPGKTENYSPVVGRDMRAELIGQGFRIVAKGPASQVLSPGSTTTWEWEVTPLRGKDYALSIKTAVEGVMADGTHVVLGSTVETRKVDVKVAWYDRVRDGLTEAPVWIKLVTGVLLALAALFGAWWKLVRSAKGEKGDDDKKSG